MNIKALASIGLSLFGTWLCYLLFTSTDMTWALLLDTLGRMDLTIAVGCPFLVAILQLFSAIKWRLVTEAQSDGHLGPLFYFRYVSASSALGQLLPLTLTNATIRALALKRKDVMPIMKAASLFIWDQGFDFLALFLLLTSGLAYIFWNLSGIATLTILATSIGAILVLMPLFSKGISKLANFLSNQSFVPAALRDKFSSLAHANILAPPLARKLLIFSVCKFVASSAFYVCIVAAFGHFSITDITFWGAPSAEMAGVLSQMPGGLGALDWTWLGILTGHGLTPQSAAAIAFGIRCALLVTNGIVAMATWFIYLLLVKQYR